MLATLFAFAFILFMANTSNFPCHEDFNQINSSSNSLPGKIWN